MHAAGGCAAHEKRDLEARLLHLLGNGDHLVQRRSDKAAEAQNVRVVLLARVEDGLARAHHAEVDHFPVVAAQHHRHDVLADVVHVTLDGGNHKGAHRVVGVGVNALLLGHQPLLLLHEGDQVRHGLLHHARRLDHLRQEHLARAEEVADGAHAVHERALDDVQRARVKAARARLLGVAHDKLVDALHKGVAQAVLHGLVTP
mmetsp:Transcript_6459/g.26271  ORF Transcript_6459/g.26271 Transcript_6459/m.26271 type:complete len:202 (+) Transcript_6459:1338-1943(+)